MSESYERERQNNARLDELSAKVSALRGVTVDIYDNARAQDVIDNTVRFLPLLSPLPLSPLFCRQEEDKPLPPSLPLILPSLKELRSVNPRLTSRLFSII